MRHVAFAYFHESERDLWEELIADRPDVVVINPASGFEAPERRPGLVAYVERLREQGALLAGYIPLAYGAAPLAQVLFDAHRYSVAWQHVGVTTLFFDEAPVATFAELVRRTAKARYLRALHGASRQMQARMSIFNPGSSPPGLVATMTALPRSVWCTWEGAQPDYPLDVPLTPYSQRRCVIVHSAHDFKAALFDLYRLNPGYGAVVPPSPNSNTYGTYRRFKL